MKKIETRRGILIESVSKHPDFIVTLKEGYSTIWNIKVKSIRWWGGVSYKSYEVRSSHSEEEAIINWMKKHAGARYDFATKEEYPELFV